MTGREKPYGQIFIDTGLLEMRHHLERRTLVKSVSFLFIFLLSTPLLGAETHVFPVPQFHVNQLDHRTGSWGSYYCGPAAVTEWMQNFRWFTQPQFGRLFWQGPAPDGTDGFLYPQVQYFAQILKTNPRANTRQQGVFVTSPLNMVSGIKEYFQNSGYPNSPVFGKGLQIDNTLVTIGDLKQLVGTNNAVVVLVGNYGFRGSRTGGHYLSVYGYRTQDQWGESQLELITMDPAWGQMINYSVKDVREKRGLQWNGEPRTFVDALVVFRPLETLGLAQPDHRFSLSIPVTVEK